MPKLIINRTKSTKELRTEYKNITQGWSDRAVQSLYTGLLEQELLVEMLSSVNSEVLDRDLSKLLTSLGLYGNIIDNEEVVEVQLAGSEDVGKVLTLDTVQKIIDRAKTLGWYPSNVAKPGVGTIAFNTALKKIKQERLENDLPTLIYILQPKYSMSTEVDLQKYYYHITSNLAYDNIKNVGLLPKEKSKLASFPSRVYILESTIPIEKSHIQNLTKNLIKYTYDQGDKVDTAYVFEIDKKYLSKRKLFVDIDFPGYEIDDDPDKYVRGVYTPEPIPPSALRDYLTFKL